MRRWTRRASALVAAGVLPLLVVACGGGESGADVSSGGATDATTAASEAPPTEGETTDPTDSTTAPGSSAPTDAAGGDELPGEPFEDFYPYEGDVLGVVGVAYDDVLNVRELPGASQAIIGELAPLADDVVVLGNHRLLPGSIWTEIELGDGTGWVNLRYLAYLGSVDDLTAEVVDRSGGEIPSAETMADLGLLVAEALDYDDKKEGSRTAISVPPTVGDLGEVTVDVIGLADDAQVGWRLHVFGAPAEAGGEGFSLKTVEATTLCGRGVTDDGRCV